MQNETTTQYSNVISSCNAGNVPERRKNMKVMDIPVVKTFNPEPLTQEKIEEGQHNWCNTKEFGASFITEYRKGRTEGFTQPRSIGSVALDLSQPYQQKVYTPYMNTISIVREDGDEKSTPKSVANFLLHVLALEWTFPSEDSHTKSVKVAIEMKDKEGHPTGEIFHFDIPLEEYSSMCKYLSKYHPQCRIYDKDIFAEELAEKYRMLAGEKIYCSYKFGGWIKRDDGTLQFLSSAMPNVESEVFLENDARKSVQFFQQYWNLANDRNKLLIVLLFVLWSGLARFFEEMGMVQHGLRSVLYISAPTGTGKTTLTSLFVKAFLKSGANPCLRFEDTGPNIEETLLIKRDIPVLIDDFYAQGSPSMDSAYEQKLSSVTRIAGDGCLRGKLGANRQLRPNRKYRGTIICTGEYLSLNTHSSVLRCWQVFFQKNSINLGPEMACLTSNIDIPRAFISGWINFLETNQKQILPRLPAMVNNNEKIAKAGLVGCKYARLITHTAALLTVGNLFTEYILSLGITYSFDIAEQILTQAREQMTLVESLAPAEVWIKSVNDAVDSGRFNLAEDEAAFIQKPSDGFIDATGVLHCISGTVDKVIEKIAYEQRMGLKVTGTVKAELVERGILKTNSSGEVNLKFSKNRKISPHRPRMYLIALKEDKNGK